MHRSIALLLPYFLLTQACDEAWAQRRVRDRVFRGGNSGDPGSGVTFTNTLSYNPSGTSEAADCGDPVVFDAATNMTVCVWAYADSSWCPGTDVIIAKWSGADTNWRIRCEASGIVRVQIGAGQWLSAGSTYSAATWNHICMAYNGGLAGNNRMKPYLNGTMNSASGTYSGTWPATLTSGAAKLWISQDDTGGSLFFGPGNIDEPLIWVGTTLSDAQITTLYNSGDPNTPAALGLPAPSIGWRMCDGDTLPTFTDNYDSVSCTAINSEADDCVSEAP